MSFFDWFKSWFTGPDPKILQVQAATVKVCSFLPLATSVAGLIAANPAVASAGVIAQQICNIVTKQPPLPPIATMAGAGWTSPPVQTWQSGTVTIQGTFVNK